MKKYGSEEVVDVALERPVRLIPSPVTARLERQQAGPLALPSFLQQPLPISASASSLEGSSSSAASNGGGSSGGGGSETVGYIRLSSFNARAQRDLAAAVRRLEAEGATRLVLDLRDNRGGLVSEGIEVARLFLQGAHIFLLLLLRPSLALTLRPARPPDHQPSQPASQLRWSAVQHAVSCSLSSPQRKSQST